MIMRRFSLKDQVAIFFGVTRTRFLPLPGAKGSRTRIKNLFCVSLLMVRLGNSAVCDRAFQCETGVRQIHTDMYNRGIDP